MITDSKDRGTLRRAAERIDAAAGILSAVVKDATQGPWRAYVDAGLISVQQNGKDDPDPVCTDAFNNGPWIALMSPAVAAPLLAWLRDAADCIREHIGEHDDVIMVDGGVLCANEHQAIEFAEALLSAGLL